MNNQFKFYYFKDIKIINENQSLCAVQPQHAQSHTSERCPPTKKTTPRKKCIWEEEKKWSKKQLMKYKIEEKKKYMKKNME